ncbi:hypothetical protein M419DRAFT_118640 [Trichoderma reesei RUT C-30]|uniref:Uncharacterized protein n=1 Tax=Hypocrea jecorina (strain ATCC 56765 / BCRC 32924 / NRRL 11460 / Rut C-30) TaxID=1344414 RepID=A0A024SAG6_HYPJR|nr:hypothetical protein M419DRAFT_118640 [Trichoderma reesei RUT C-30]
MTNLQRSRFYPSLPSLNVVIVRKAEVMLQGARARVPTLRPGCGELRVDEERDTRVCW